MHRGDSIKFDGQEILIRPTNEIETINSLLSHCPRPGQTPSASTSTADSWSKLIVKYIESNGNEISVFISFMVSSASATADYHCCVSCVCCESWNFHGFHTECNL